MKYIGIDGCRGGWFFIALDADGLAEFGILESISELDVYLDNAELILLDIPIGLREREQAERLCDKQARAVLQPKRGASVFPAPSRCALQSETYQEANKLNKTCTGRGLSKQTFNILPKIREVDEYLQDRLERDKIHEMHPELCFWALNGCRPMAHNKKTVSGYEERVSLLADYYIDARKIIEHATEKYPGNRVARDDIVDALVGSITASHAGSLSRFPQQPEVDKTGLTMEIVYWAP